MGLWSALKALAAAGVGVGILGVVGLFVRDADPAPAGALAADDDVTGVPDDERTRVKVETLIRAADEDVQKGRYSEAEREYQAALTFVSATPGGPESLLAGLIHHELGTLYKLVGRLSLSETSFTLGCRCLRASVANGESGSLDPLCKSLCELSEVKTLLSRETARVEGQEDEEEAAARALHEARGLAREAVELLEKERGREPGDVQHKRVLADALRSLTQAEMFRKDWKAAEETIRRCLSLLLVSTFEGDPSVVTARMWLSQILLGMERYDEACSECRTLAATHHGSAEEAYFVRYLGEVLVDCDKCEEAERTLLRSLLLYHRSSPGAQPPASEVRQVKGLESEESWASVNDIAALAFDAEREELGWFLIRELAVAGTINAEAALPDTSSRYLRTLQCGIHPAASGTRNTNSYAIQVLVRERNSKKLPRGSWLVFCFQRPGSTDVIPMNVEQQFTASCGKTVTVASPTLEGFVRNTVYTISVRVFNEDKSAMISQHVQLVRFVPHNASSTLSL